MWAIAAGLFIGKQIGVFGFTYGAVRAGICEMPQGTRWVHIYADACYGISLSCSQLTSRPSMKRNR